MLVTLWYKLSIRPLPEVLMRESLSRPRALQSELFHPPQQSPAWQKLPQEIRRQTVELLAQLLRQHSRRIMTADHGRETVNE